MAANLLWVFWRNFYIMVVIIYDLVGVSMCEFGSSANWCILDDKDSTRIHSDYKNVVSLRELSM